GHTRQRLVVRAELSKRWVSQHGGGPHIKETLWIIPTLRHGSGGWGPSSAGPGAGAGELAVGRIAAFVDALQALGDDGLELPDLVLFVGFFGIHRSGAMTWAATGLRTMPTS